MSAQAGRGHWGSRAGFLFAAAGSAVGLGNIWRFTYLMGEGGGAAFVLVYLACIGLIAVPVFLAELVIGRASRRSPVGAFRSLAPRTRWVGVGYLGVIVGFLVLTFYSVVGGWVLYYLLMSPLGRVAALATPEQAGAAFAALGANGALSVACQLAFMVVTVAIVAGGVRGGIERASRTMMPALLVLLAILIVRGLLLPGAGEGVRFILAPDFSRLGPATVMAAMGQALFTLGVGMGAMITYGSYIGDRTDLARSSLEVAGIDTFVAIAAGFAIFPALFALGMEPAQGPGLLFVTLPVMFSKLGAGSLFATMFFLLVLLAAVTSSISMLEVVTAYFIDERGWERRRAAIVIGVAIFVGGIPAALSSGPLAGWSLAGSLGLADGPAGDVAILAMGWFDLVGHVVSDYLLAIGALCITIFLGWRWPWESTLQMLRGGALGPRGRELFRLAARWLVPLVVVQVLALGALGELGADRFLLAAAAAERLRAGFVWLTGLLALALFVGAARVRGEEA